MEELVEEKRNYKWELLSSLSWFEISCIINDKKKEIRDIEEKYLSFVDKNTTEEERIILWMLKDDKIKPIGNIIFSLDFELRQRNWEEFKDFKKEIDNKKLTVSIVDVINHYIWLNNYRKWQLLKCPFPNHKDSTASFYIYEKSNTFCCFWCNKMWSAIDFIMNYNNIPLKKAIEIFLNF